MSRGYVYILTNPSMPGLVKIGKTTRDVQQRANELWQTGVPTPFEVYGEVTAPDCHDLERRVHHAVSEFRVSAGREFFQAEPAAALTVLLNEHREMVEAWLDDFLPDQRIVESDFALEDCNIRSLAQAMDVHSLEVVSAIHEIRAEELREPMRRWEEKCEARRKKMAAGISPYSPEQNAECPE